MYGRSVEMSRALAERVAKLEGLLLAGHPPGLVPPPKRWARNRPAAGPEIRDPTRVVHPDASARRSWLPEA